MSKENGRFEKGNEIGKETRFQYKNAVASKYRAEYEEKMLNWFRESGEGYPTFELFAESIGVTAETLTHWAESHPRFRDTYARCKNIQKGKLIAFGLAGAYNPQIVKFVAVNNHGMKDKVETDVKGGEDFQVNINVVKQS